MTSRPRSVLICATALLFCRTSILQTAGIAAAEATASSSANAPLIRIRDTVNAGGSPGHLYHQVLREALLMAARDEFNAVTFDDVLRDAPPPGSANQPSQWEVLSNFAPNRFNFDVTLNRIQDGAPKQVWKKPFIITKPDDDALEKETARAELAARNEFLSALEDEGFKRQPLTWREDAEVPAEIEKRLDDLSLVSQFIALRELHALIRHDAESPQRLSALARAYANLGMLTEHVWTSSTKALTARALLYAERLYAKQPGAAASLWCRGYVRALAGRQHTAIRDFSDAEELSAKSAVSPPRWAALADALCLYDAKTLSTAGDERSEPLRCWLYFLANESTDVPEFLGLVVEDVLEKSPDAYRAIDIVANQRRWVIRSDGARAGQRVSAQQIYSRLSELSETPEAVKQVCAQSMPMAEPAAEYALRGSLFKALRAAAAEPQQRGEPSWAVLSTLLEDLALVQAGRSLNAIGDDADDMLTQLQPLLAEHPYAKLLGLHAGDRQVQSEALEFARQFDSRSLTASAGTLFETLYRKDPDLYFKRTKEAFTHEDDTFRDQMVVYRSATEGTRDFALNLLKRIAKNMPVTVGGMLARQHDMAKPQVPQWEIKYADQPDVLLRLGRYYRDGGQVEKAMQIWRHEIDLYSDREAYLLLAETYLKQGDEEKWLANWEEYFAKVPDYGLEHAQIARTIAWHFIEQRQWRKAKPYADRAASSGASWALITAGSCTEALGDWSTAEDYFRHNTKAFGNQPIDWYCFCRRTGNGKTDEARQVVTKFIADYDPQTANVAPFYLGVFYAIDGKFDDAYRWLKPYCEHTKTTATLLLTALVADRLKDSETRDALLLKARCPNAIEVSTESKHPRTELVLLAELLADDLAAGGHGAIDMAEVARRSVSAESGDRAAFYFLLGEYFDLHEQRAKMVDCWKQAMLDSDIDTAYRSLAGARLLDRSIGPDSYLVALQTPLTKEELNPPPPPRLRHQPDAVEFHGHYYKFIPAHLNWDEAKEQAQGLGGVLVCITSEAEQKAVVPLAERKSAWIGGYREDGKWKWASGEPFQFERFNRSNIVLDHLRLMPNGRWVGGRNHPDEVTGFICEWEK